MLTPAQSKLLKFIKEYQSENDGTCPTYREMMKAVGLGSTSGIHRLVTGLEKRGVISRFPRRQRTIQVHDEWRDLSQVSSAALIAEIEHRRANNRWVA